MRKLAEFFSLSRYISSQEGLRSGPDGHYIMKTMTIIMIRTVIKLVSFVVKVSVHQIFGKDTKTTWSVEREEREDVKMVHLNQRMGNLFVAEQNIRLPTPF